MLGKAGTLTGYLRGYGPGGQGSTAPPWARAVNAARGAVEAALEEPSKRALAAKPSSRRAIEAGGRRRFTLPGRGQQVGTRHLINAISDEISEIFLGLGLHRG